MSKLKKIKNAVVTTGEYTDNDGNTKKRYINVGAMFKYEDGGVTVKLDCLPLMEGDVWINFYDLKDRDEPTKKEAPKSDDLDDSIPF